LPECLINCRRASPKGDSFMCGLTGSVKPETD
jgi:hypothetical protein